MLSTEQQCDVRAELLKSLAPDNKYGEAALRLQFKQALVAVAREAEMPEGELAGIAALSRDDVFHDYAVGNMGQGMGLYALIRVYGMLRGPESAGALRDRMQQLAEENAIHGGA